MDHKKQTEKAQKIAAKFAAFLIDPELTGLLGNALHMESAKLADTRPGLTLDAIVGLLDETYPEHNFR
jgi:hypothetical protein